MSVTFGVIELVCVGVLLLLCLGVVGLLILTLLKRQREAPQPATLASSGPSAGVPQAAMASAPSFLSSSEASAAVVARLAERFCPSCRAPLERDAPEGLCPACLMAGGLGSRFAASAPDGLAATTPPGERPASADHDVADLQTKFPQLEILELLGRGGMGAVYKVRQRNLDRIVALKVIPPAAARDPEFAERFAREARALARLNHPNIVTVYDFGQSEDVYYLLMEYVDGVNLRHTMRASSLQPEEALAVVPQICDALQYAHDQGVVHRDIKPENVLLDRSGRIKIADFGLAKLLGLGAEDFSLTRTQQVMGTPRYMAPEQIDRPSKVDHRADIYSLGVVIYEMLTGELPVGRFALPSERTSIDPHIDRVVLRSLEREPEQRYQRASHLKSDLAAVPLDREPGGDWSGPRFPTPAPVYVDPKPPQYNSAANLPRLGYLLLLAAGMVIGCLMLTVGLSLALLAIVWPPFKVTGGLLGAAFGFLCGGGGALVGSYHSYRQLAGSQDMLRAARTTWFDWVMRGFLLVGILLFVASLIDFPATFTELMVVGIVMIVQGSLFALVRSLVPADGNETQQNQLTSGRLQPTLWRAAVVPTLVLAAIWGAVVLDVFYAKPNVVADDRTARWMTYLFYGAWQTANWAIGVGLVPICFAVLAIAWSLAARRTSGTTTVVPYPFANQGWLLAVAALAISTAIFPWVRLEHFSEHTITINRMERMITREIASIDMPTLAGFTGQYRYASREVVALGIALSVAVGFILGVLALLPIPSRARSIACLAAGLTLLACCIHTLHAMADQPSQFFLDVQTIDGITNFSRLMDDGRPDLSAWAKPLAEVIAVRPSLGILALLAAAIGSLFLGLSGLSWEVPAEAAATSVQKAAPLPIRDELVNQPADQARQRALNQVRGPATGLCLAGVIGLAVTGIALPLMLFVTPIVTVTRHPATVTRQLSAVVRTAATEPKRAFSELNSALGDSGDAFRFAQQMAPEDVQRRTRATWVTIAMPILLAGLLNVPISLLLIVGGLRMRKLESYWLCFGASVVACLPCTPIWLFGLPMGLWSLSVLARPEVKAAFDRPVA